MEMGTITTSLITLAALFGGALFGMFLHSRLPEHHLNEDSIRIVNLGSGIIATMAALVLGLLVASAKGNFDTQNNEVLDASAKIAVLDRVLSQYGSDSKPARERLREIVEHAAHRLWPENRSAQGHLSNDSQGANDLLNMIQNLPAANDAQRNMKGQVLSISMSLAQTRWLVYAQQESSASKPLVVIVVFWLTINFISFGLLAPRNATVVLTLFICAVAVSSAIFLMMEMYNPFGGLIQISGAPLRNVIAQIGQ